jgi:uncharacterized repeat protein (TIGR03803 family)
MRTATLIICSVLLTCCSRVTAPSALPAGPPSGASAQPLAGHGYHSIYSFKSNPDGASPAASLIEENGLLYGTTRFGGTNGNGSIFDVHPTGKEGVLYSFKSAPTDGVYPDASLIDVNGVFYGTTYNGGSSTNCSGGCGTVFALHPSTRKERVLYDFKSDPDGANPGASLIYVNGNFYGVTWTGGSGYGTVFEVSATGKEHVTYTFKGSPDGANPNGSLIAVSGTLYGTTANGGAKETGTVFAVDPSSGKELWSFSFNGGTEPANPNAGLIDVKSVLYGTSTNGGANGDGTVFAVDPSTHKEKWRYSFKGYPLGASPDASLIDVNGTLYGTTYGGGSYCSAGCGTVFAIDPSTRKERLLYSFRSNPDGANPDASLIDVSGKLYGTTLHGGSGYGTVFRISP